MCFYSDISQVGGLTAATLKLRNVSRSHEHYYRPQTKFAKVMFLHLSVCPLGGGGGMHGGGGGVCVVWWGACIASGGCV